MVEKFMLQSEYLDYPLGLRCGHTTTDDLDSVLGRGVKDVAKLGGRFDFDDDLLRRGLRLCGPDKRLRAPGGLLVIGYRDGHKYSFEPLYSSFEHGLQGGGQLP